MRVPNVRTDVRTEKGSSLSRLRRELLKDPSTTSVPSPGVRIGRDLRGTRGRTGTPDEGVTVRPSVVGRGGKVVNVPEEICPNPRGSASSEVRRRCTSILTEGPGLIPGSGDMGRDLNQEVDTYPYH